MDKRDLRNQMKQKRDATTITFQGQASKCIQNRVLEMTQDFPIIALYVSMGSEVQSNDLLSKLLLKHTVVVPRVVDKKTMEFVKINSKTQWKKSAYGAFEPVQGEVIEPISIDCFLIPLLAFDEQGGRLGYGGGYYDRVLFQSHAYKIGLAYDFQKTQFVPMHEHDVYLDEIISEKQVYKVQEEII